MKATGIVRRIDDLGRVVIPKEIRRTMRIREGDPLEIYTDKDGGVIFKKYSLMGGLVDFAGQLCETLNRTTGRVTVITDRDSCIAVAGAPKRELMEKQVSSELERLMEGRQIYQHKGGEAPLPLCTGEDKFCLDTVAPILSEGDVLGSVVFVSRPEELEGGDMRARIQPASLAAIWRDKENREREAPGFLRLSDRKRGSTTRPGRNSERFGT